MESCSHSPQEQKKHKVIYLADDLESVVLLKEMLELTRREKVKNFIMISQMELDEPAPDGSTTAFKYFFYGKDSCLLHLGLCNRMADMINRYMSGEDIFSEYEEGE